MNGRSEKTLQPNPKQKASILSKISFSYALPTIFAGLKRRLTESDIYLVFPEQQSSNLGDRLEKQWQKEEEKRKPSFNRAVVNVFWREICYYNLFAIAGDLTWFVQPFLLDGFLKVFTPENRESVGLFAWLYVTGIILCSLANAIFLHHYMHNMLLMGIKLQAACSSLVFRKSLALSKSALNTVTNGHILNLVAADTNVLLSYILFSQFLLIVPAECLLTACLLYIYVDYFSFIGVMAVVAFFPLQGVLSHMVKELTRKSSVKADERIKLTNEMISRIDIIKMFTWEDWFVALISKARETEMKSIRQSSYIHGILMSFSMFLVRAAIFFTALSFTISASLMAENAVFIIYAMYSVVRSSMYNFFPQALFNVAQSHVSMDRLENFLLLSEATPGTDGRKPSSGRAPRLRLFRELSAVKLDLDRRDCHSREDLAINLTGVSARWKGTDNDILSGVSLRLGRGQRAVLVGPSGSGKSSLLHVLLDLLRPTRGHVHVRGTVSYAAQEPWLFAGTVRQNILFGSPMDAARYAEVVRASALERDLAELPRGDETSVSEQGTSLSGGQRARVALARALYREAEIYLLDDPRSAVDAAVARHLLSECVCGFLRSKTVVMVETQQRNLDRFEHVVYMEGGRIRAQGTYEQVHQQGVLIESSMEGDVDKLCSIKDEKEASAVELQQKQEPTSKKMVGSGKEDVPQASPLWRVYWRYFAAAGWCAVLSIAVFFVSAQVFATYSDYLMVYWMDPVAASESINLDAVIYSSSTQFTNDTRQVQPPQLAGNQSSSSEPSAVSAASPTHDSYILYAVALIGIATVSMIRAMLFFYAATRASSRLHKGMLASVSRGTTRFFAKNGTGRILNRFSNDIYTVDRQLPHIMMEVFQGVLVTVGVLFVVAYVDLWLLLPSLVLGLVAYVAKRLYVPTARDLRRLERATQSPVLAHMNSTLRGHATVKAFQMEKRLIVEFDERLDLHTATAITLQDASRAFGFWLDMFCLIYVVIVTVNFLARRSEEDLGKIGLAVTQSVSLTNIFQWLLRQLVEMDSLMTSVERIAEYDNIDSEDGKRSKQVSGPPRDWPHQGNITFKDVSLKYSPGEPSVLKKLNFLAASGEKIGIVGRTGAGKTSIIKALFQMADTEGDIIIDGVNIKDISLHDLRSNILIIPQEIALFSGTVRSNLDPVGKHSDKALWHSLEKSKLKHLICNLDSKVDEFGLNFSVGQRQLLCLARAILNRKKILIMDESSGKLDQEAENIIQKTIRAEFGDCTVLTISHRLSNIVDSDKVMVVDKGQIREFDHPHVLLQNRTGFFTAMVEHSQMATQMRKIARDNFRTSINDMGD